MSADRTPPAEHSFLARPMRAITDLLLRRPGTTVAVALIVACLALLLAGTQLGYKTSRLDLLDPKSDYNRRWIEYLQDFGDEDDAVIVVQGSAREQVLPVMKELAQAVTREKRLFHCVLHEVDRTKLRAKGLYYVTDDELAGVEQFVREMAPVVQGDWARVTVSGLLNGFAFRVQRENEAASAAGITTASRDLQRFANGLLAHLEGSQEYVSPWPSMTPTSPAASEPGSELLLNDGRIGFVLLRLAPEQTDGFARGSEATDTLRQIIRDVAARHRAAGVSIGLTGLPIMENDEMRASQSSMLYASLVSLAGVALLFVAGFGGARHALLANGVLLIGMAWAFGYVTLSVGHLNILSITFAVTLIGIGIDYGVYYVARYMKLRNDGLACRDALLQTTHAVGPAIAAGAATTAVSFFAAGFTSFPGVAELGIIAGGGILLCCAAQLFVLPAVLYLVDRGDRGQQMPCPLPVHAWINPLLKAPRLLLVATGAVTIFLASGIGRLWYDHNLLNLQPAELESVKVERMLVAECDRSMYYAISIADSPAELLSRKAEFLKLDSVERAEEIVSTLPSGAAAKQPIVADIGRSLAALPEQPPVLPVDSLEALGAALGGAYRAAAGDRECAQRLDQAYAALQRLPPADYYRALTGFQQRVAVDLLARLHALRGIAHPAPPAFSDLPASLVERYVGRSGRHLLKVYGRGDIWDMQALSKFVQQVRSVDLQATGHPLQAYEASLEMKSSYEHAAVMAIVVIFGVLLFDFRSLRYALLAALPLGWGMLQTFGLLGLLNIPLNPANMIALPLILGIGVDYGVHMVHELREQQGRYKLSSATAIAVLVDALTTIVGFGSLMIASHRGLQSLGRVLTLGITCCMFTSLIMLPALLTWLTWNRREEPHEAEDEAESGATSDSVPSGDELPAGQDEAEAEPRVSQPLSPHFVPNPDDARVLAPIRRRSAAAT